MITIATLVVKLVGDIADYSASLQQSQEMTDTFSNRAVSGLADLGGGIVMGALAAGTTAVVGLGAAAWQAGEQIDGAMDIIQTQTGATGEVLSGLRGTFDAVFSAVPASADQSATVIAALNTRLGMTGGVLEETSVKFLNMTNLLGGDASTNAALFARVVGDWSVPLEENSVLLDKLFVASQKTGVPVEKLMTNVVQFGAPLRNMNFGLDESIALFAKWEKEGVNAELVMGSLRIAAGKFADENIPLRKGLEDTFDAIKNAKSSSEALSVAMEIFGSRAAGDMSAAIREGRFDIDDMTQALGGAEGAINKTTAATADWPEMWQKVSNTMTVSLAPIGDTLRGVTGSAIEMLGAWLSKPETKDFIQDIADGVAWLGDRAQEYLPKIGGWIQDGLGWLDENKGVVVAALAIITAAIVAWAVTSAIAVAPLILELLPVIAVILLIGGLAYLLYEAWTNNWGGIQEKTGAAVAFLMNIIQAGVSFIQAVWDRHGAAIMAVGSNTWQMVVNTVRGYLAFFREIFLAFSSLFERDLEGFGEHIGKAWRALWDMASENFKLFGQNIKIIAGEWWRNLVDFFQALDWAAIGRGILDGIKAGLSFGLDDLLKIVGDVVEGMQSAFTDPLEIHSPSGWARRQVGWPTGEGAMIGAAEGVERNQDRVAGSLARALPGMAGAVAGMRGGGGGINLVVQYTDANLISAGNDYQLKSRIGPAVIELLRQYKVL